MKIVKTGEVTRIFSDDLQTFDSIPVGNYKVCFHPMMGFYLEDADSFKNNEKPYGKHPEKLAKAVNLYNQSERSAGILLSGKKGMGKSMFARLLSESFAETHNMPTILVTEAYRGIVDFIESIKQECVVMFDEFEKVFDESEKKEPQDKLLGLFDGVSQTKRLYVVTVNNLGRVNQYMLDRPGRFHYHLQFNFPTNEEIALYLTDKLKPEFHRHITLVQRFSNRFDLNYDSLRAIAFELNSGYGFIETMEDLNISSSNGQTVRYDVEIHHSNGLICRTYEDVNLMSSRSRVSYRTEAHEYAQVTFSPLEVEIHDKSSFVVDRNCVDLEMGFSDENEVLTDESGITVDKIIFTVQAHKTQYGKEMSVMLA